MALLDLEGLRQRPDLLARIDWDLTPGEAFEAYQLKSRESWRQRGLSEAIYFYLSVWRGERRLLLVRRTLVHSEELAEVQAPPELVEACLARGEGQQVPRGQVALDEPLKAWLRAQLWGAEFA